MEQNNEVVITEASRMKQMWGWWRAKLDMAAKSPWYASYLLRRFYELMKALKPSKQLVASTVTGAALLVGSIAMNPAPAQAAGITVNTTDGGAPVNDGKCSLNEAIIASYINAQLFGVVAGECAAGGVGSDTIDLTNVGGATITLTADLNANNTAAGEDMVFNGPGVANLTIDGVAGGFLTIRSTGAAKNITINGLTITGAKYDGVYATGSITVTNSTISGNGFAGVKAAKNATVTGSTISGNGLAILPVPAAIAAVDNVTVTDSTVSGNKHSGIIASNGNATVTGSTITGNKYNGVKAQTDVTVTNSTVSGTVTGDGVNATAGNVSVTNSTISANQKQGVNAINGNASVTNSTVSGNTLNGVRGGNNTTVTNSTISGNGTIGVFTFNNDVTVINSTITGNTTQGVYTTNADAGAAVITLKNSLIVGNTGKDVDCAAAGATLASNGKNLIKTQAGAACTMASEVTALAVASIMGPLANNGGSTETHALVAAASNPAVNKGLDTDSPGATDQRGQARIQGGTIDIGAFESAFADVAKAVGGVAEFITPPVNDGVAWRVVGMMGAGLAMGLGVLGLSRAKKTE